MNAKTTQHLKWKEALSDATLNGYLAGLDHKPTPMVVYSPKAPFVDESPDYSQPVYHVPSGVCGFAWVNLKAKKGPEGKEARQFLNWLLGRSKPAPGAQPTAYPGFRLPDKKAYGGGYNLWVSGFDQSMECKYAAACVVAKALNEAVPGLTAWAQERMD